MRAVHKHVFIWKVLEEGPDLVDCGVDCGCVGGLALAPARHLLNNTARVRTDGRAGGQ